ncbi:hypothetical protein FB45DRAFT_1009994 [Roridomyces roridus]|uniref:F-box domain-containing protein n=1 Tax=Roridomyces roridus TaxID=1738132 RepID=A0AAD7B564_9AGAR|nr:hypothetical protein FB45DRAFT_1009994 [Roridomyces roridus]
MNNPYLSSCRDNIVPRNEQERAAIRQAISDLQHRVDEDPDAANAAGLRAEIALLSSLFAPVRRLPPEILSAIVMQPNLHAAGISRGPESATAHFGGRASPSLVARLLEMYLERSKQFPLSIEIRALRPGTIHSGILHQLVESSDRWASLRLTLEPSHLSALSAIRGRLPLLSSLEFYIAEEWDSPFLPETVRPDYFEIAPRLTRLKLALPSDVSPLLPLSQIKTLIISSWFNLNFAAQCPNLHTLSIPADSAFWGKVVPDGVSRVEVSAAVLSTFPLMLEFITAPNVQLLAIVAGKVMQSQGAWTAFVERSACRPHTLQMEDVVITSSELIDLLALLPGLHTLDLHNLRPGAITNKLLAPLTEGTTMLPELKNLNISGSYLFSNVALLDMLESRLESLERVQLRLTQRTFTEVELGRARAVKQKGLELALWCLDAEKKFARVV